MSKSTKKQPDPPLSDQLRKIIEQHEQSRNAICMAAEVAPSQLHRFIHGTDRRTIDDPLVTLAGYHVFLHPVALDRLWSVVLAPDCREPFQSLPMGDAP